MSFLIWLLGILTYGSTDGMRDWVGQLLMYIYATIDTTDYMNDYLSHIVDDQVRAVAQYLGWYLVTMLGL